MAFGWIRSVISRFKEFDLDCLVLFVFPLRNEGKIHLKKIKKEKTSQPVGFIKNKFTFLVRVK